MKTYWRGIRNFKEWGVAPRMVAAFVLFVLIPFLCLATVVLWFYQENTISSLQETTMDTIAVAASGIHTSMLEREEDSMALYYNGCVELLGKDKVLSPQEEQQITDQLSACCYSNTGVLAAYLKTEQGVFHSGGSYEEALTAMEPYEEEIIEAGGRCLWYTTDKLYGNFYENNYILVRSLNSRTEKNVGILYFVMNDKMIKDALGSASTKYADWYLTTADGAVLYASDVEQMWSVLDVSMLSQDVKRSYHVIKNEEKKEEIIAAYSLMDVGWYCISKIKTQAVRQDAFSLAFPFILTAFVCVLFMLFMLYMLQRYVFVPLRVLKSSMDQYAQSEIGETQLEIIGIGEFKSLSEHFNRMTVRISKLMQAYKEEEDEKNRQKMKALSAQLTPHFIYNALNTIKWMAVLNHQEKIQHLVESLVSIFMNAARVEDETYTLKDELELVKNYAVIQKARFMNFDLMLEAEEESLDCRIRKLLLQPVVENAIVHGLNRGKVKNGKIWVKTWTDEELHITVTDEGVGFDVEKWRLHPVKNKEHTNIGITNVEEIIRLEYGEGYGMNIDSEPGKGTKITYTLPIIKKGEET